VKEARLYALDAVAGAVKWTTAAALTAVESSPAIANVMVYVGSDDDDVYAFGLP